jgi:hypothetical protein
MITIAGLREGVFVLLLMATLAHLLTSETRALRVTLEKLVRHEWIIAAWQVDGVRGWRVHTRDEPSREEESQTYTGDDRTFARTILAAALKGVAVCTPVSPDAGHG